MSYLLRTQTARLRSIDSVAGSCGETGDVCVTGGRDAAGLLPLLQFLCKFLVDPRYSRLLLGVAHRVLDAYAGEVNS